jgi:hypothetical protein
MRNSPLIAFTAVLLPIIAGCATAAESQAEDINARMERAAGLLAQRTGADSQAAAGLLSVFRHPEQSLRLVAQATLQAPERSDLAWLHIQLCLTDTSCDPEPLEKLLRASDEKNGAGWFDELARASRRGDKGAESAALAAIGRSERVDFYWTTLVARLSRQVASTEVVSLIDAESHVIGALAGVAIPAYQAVSNACKGERLLRDDVVEVCRGIANSLLNGDTIITEMIGVAIARRAWPENAPKWMEANEARRIWDYRAQFADSFDVWHRNHVSEHLDLVEQHRREQDVYKAALIAMGKNPYPSE